MYFYFRDLQVWQRSMVLAKSIHACANKLPKYEQYGLADQLRRSAVSIPSNIAEGSQRSSDRDFAKFISIAKGSLAEVLTQILLAKDFGYLDHAETEILTAEIQEIDRMLYAFRNTLYKTKSGIHPR